MLKSNRVYLWGFMGCGKSTIGLSLAKTLSIPFLDTDQQVEMMSCMNITEIFHQHGEAYFRFLESQVLHHTNLLHQAIIATGGGLPSNHNLFERMNELGITIYLQMPFDELWQRIQKDHVQRPMVKSFEQMQALYLEREKIYHKAHITVNATMQTSKIITQIVEEISKKK